MQKRYEIILNSIADGVYTVDLDWRITSFNQAAEKITGISRQEAIGQSCFEVLRSSVCEKNCILQQTLATGKPIVNMPVYIIRADKSRIPICATTALFKDSQDKVMGGVVTFRDLTALNELKKELLKQHSFGDIISKNAKMLNLFATLPQIAQSRSTVLIEGESGTGKELFARAVHNNSLNRNGPFIAVNCAALPDTLIESELFGYKAGAFTDAKKDKPGRFAQAHNGTIFLDEIGDVSPAIQIRLLRVLENREYEPLGAIQPTPTNARVVAATHRNLEKLIQEDKFREDLYYRLNVVNILLPPLAERKEDIPLLVNHFIRHFNQLTEKNVMGISREAMATIMLHNWPGNVRELENAIEHAFVICQDKLIRIQHLPDRIIPVNGSLAITEGLTLKEIEKRVIKAALRRNQWKRMATAKELDIDKNTLRRKITRLKIAVPQ
jgi:PAS domain S-box-containing protein